MADTPMVATRAEPDLIRDAAERAGLLGAPASQVIRYALALLAGRPDPHTVARLRPGPKPRSGAAA